MISPDLSPSSPPLPREYRPEAEIILVFASNTEVLNVEDMLEERDLEFELVPVPKRVNPNCGLAISFQEPARPSIMAALAEAGLAPRSAYRRQGEEFEIYDYDRSAWRGLVLTE